MQDQDSTTAPHRAEQGPPDADSRQPAPAAAKLADLDLTDALALDDDEIRFLVSTGC